MLSRILSPDFIFGTMITASILAPFVEEVGFRGIFQGYLSKITKPITAILIVSVVFTGFHLFETDFSSKTQILISVVARFIEAIFWGTIYYRTKNLSYTVILHSFANFSSGLVIMVLDSRFLEFIFKFV